MRTREILSLARRDGAAAGKNAANWADDGLDYAAVLQGIEGGDPKVLDGFRIPNLSGEWDGDDPTSLTLAEDYDLDLEDDARSDWLLNEVCTVWLEAASNAFWVELERICRYHAEEVSS